jgi:hypothetical protein
MESGPASHLGVFFKSIVPTTPTTIISTDCFLFELDIPNNTGGTIVFTATEGNGDILIPGYSILPGSVMSYRSGGRHLSGGLIWSMDTASIKATGRYRAG